jgi:hypothetical protein
LKLSLSTGNNLSNLSAGIGKKSQNCTCLLFSGCDRGCLLLLDASSDRFSCLSNALGKSLSRTISCCSNLFE